MNDKTCFKCNKTKPLSEFYKHKQMADGHLNKCKSCTRLDAAIHRDKNIERVRAYDRRRGNRQPPSYQKEYREKNPAKYKATVAVNNALRQKKIEKAPCEVCGRHDVHGHHDDYAKPLEVRWLCPIHHRQWHIENGEGRNG